MKTLHLGTSVPRSFTLGIMSGNLFPSASGRNFFDDGLTSRRSKSITECHENHFIDTFFFFKKKKKNCSVWFYPRSLDIHSLVLSHPSGVKYRLHLGLKLNQTWVCCSKQLCATIAPAYIAGRTPCL